MEQEEELHSFHYEATIGGKEHYYRITQNDGKYGYTILFNTAELLESICRHIEAHYD